MFETIGFNKYAEGYYSNALKELEHSNTLMDNGIFFEYIAQFYLKTNNINQAKYYLQQSLDSYSKWGAHAKVEHLNQSLLIN